MIDLTIRTPGVYQIPNAAYHAQICDGPSISSTGLRTIALQSPAHFWAYSDLNPFREPEEVKPKVLNFGNAAHSLLLEGALPKSEYAIAPFVGNYAKNEPGWNAGDKRAWRDEQQAAGMIVVSPDDIAKIERMAEVLRRHPLVMLGLFRGEVERALFVKRGKYWLKSKPDVIPEDTIIADYKTVADAGLRAVTNANVDHGYYMQIALAIDLIRETTGREIENATLLVQEKEPPYAVVSYALSDHFINIGRARYERAFETFIACYEANEWPCYCDQTLYVPSWLETQLEQEGIK